MRRFIPLLALCILAGSIPAQVQVLTTTFAFNNGQSGNMFDLVATNPVTICSLDVHLDPGTWDMEVYIVTGGGTITGNETNAAAWTLIGSTTGLVSNGTGVATPMPISVNIPIANGQTQGFYVTVTNGTSINYTNGTSAGSVYASDANLQYLEGVGKSYPFGSTFTPRIWNGNINYVVGAGNCGQLPFQVNQAGSSLDFDGVQSNGFQPAVTTANLGQTVNMNSSGGGPYEIGAALAPIIPGGFLQTPGGQTVNVDMSHPTLFWVNGGTTVSLAPHPGSFTLPISSPTIVTGAAQQLSLDPIHVDGFLLSQASELRVVADPSLGPGNPACSPGASPLVLSDDSFSQQALGFTYPFYGVGYTEVFVGSNGHCTFNAGLSGWASGSASLNGGNPTIAVCSEDFNPSAGGTVSFLTDNLTSFEVCWSGVPSFAATNSNDFKVSANAAGFVTFDFGNMDEVEGTVGLSAGSAINTPFAMNLSAAGGINGPVMIPAGSTPYEDFTLAGQNLDLDNLQVIWLMDAMGTPLSVQ